LEPSKHNRIDDQTQYSILVCRNREYSDDSNNNRTRTCSHFTFIHTLSSSVSSQPHLFGNTT